MTNWWLTNWEVGLVWLNTRIRQGDFVNHWNTTKYKVHGTDILSKWEIARHGTQNPVTYCLWWTDATYIGQTFQIGNLSKPPKTHYQHGDKYFGTSHIPLTKCSSCISCKANFLWGNMMVFCSQGTCQTFVLQVIWATCVKLCWIAMNIIFQSCQTEKLKFQGWVNFQVWCIICSQGVFSSYLFVST